MEIIPENLFKKANEFRESEDFNEIIRLSYQAVLNSCLVEARSGNTHMVLFMEKYVNNYFYQSKTIQNLIEQSVINELKKKRYRVSMGTKSRYIISWNLLEMF